MANKSANEPEVLLETRLFRVEQVQEPLRDGTTAARQFVRHPGAVVILPLLEGDRVCLIRNRRVAVGKTLLELPAGTLEPGEPPAATAPRELAEETGYRSENWRELPGFYMSPGILDERMHVFVAQQLTAGETAREPGEFIENHVVAWSEAMAMCQDGRIEDAKSLVVLLMWNRLRQ